MSDARRLSTAAASAEPAQLVFERGDEEPHLEAPVAEVRVAPHLVAAKPEDALDALADDRRAQVTDVHGLRHVRPAVVDDHAALVLTSPAPTRESSATC